MLVLVFSIGAGFLSYVTQGNFSTLQGQQARAQSEYSMSLEQLSLTTGISGANLQLLVTNTGSVVSVITDAYVFNTATNSIASQSGVSPYLTTAAGLPTTLPVGSSRTLTIHPASFGCADIVSACPALGVTLLTLQGNIFSAQYPPPAGPTITATTTTQSSASTSTISSGNPGGSVLVVQMKATPPQTTVSCSSCVFDTVTVYNYGTSQVTSVALFPTVPIISSTNVSPVGTALVTLHGSSCANAGGTTINAYSGSGPVPYITFTCTYDASLQGFGGFVSFIGAAEGMYNGFQVTSGDAISNTIQIGGPVSPLNQGPFSANFFYYKYSSCQNNPTGSSACTTTPNPLNVNNLPGATPISGNNYYVAFYVQITNNFNTTLPILPYSFMFVDPEIGSDSSFFISGTPQGTNCPGTSCSWATYLPNYNPGTNPDTPQISQYPTTCTAQATSTCLYLNPGQTATLTFAACDITSTYWNWGGATYGRSQSGSCTTNAPSFSTNGSTYVAIILTFVWNNQVWTQDIPFVGEYVQ
jgi:hypothetical protein